MNVDDYVSTTEAADLLGISRQLVQHRIRVGILPKRKIGNNWVLLRKDVLKHKRTTQRGKS